MTYDIREKLEFLEKTKGSATKYKCPVCNGSNLNIQHSTGKYKCYSSNCEEKAIREAIDELEGKPKYSAVEWVKPQRPASKVSYYYPDREGNDLAKVDRIDHGEGKKDFYQSHKVGEVWVKGMPPEIRSQIPIYNYAQCQEAVKNNILIWWAEGEATADALTKIGLVATTTIGGSGGLASYGDYSRDLAGARVILCPDRDANGLKYIQAVSELLGDAVEGVYLVGVEGLWRDPQGGMDLVDELADYGYSPEQLISRIKSKAEYKALLDSFYKNPVPAEVKPKKSIVTDLERANLASLIILRKSDNKSPDIYPQRLAACIERDARRQNIDPASYSVYLLPAIVSLMGHTSLALGGGFEVPNIIWSVIIQPSGGGKTRAESAIKAPLFRWEREAYVSYCQKNEAYKLALAANKKGGFGFSGDPPGDPPLRRKYLIEMATPQAVVKRLADQYETGVAWFRDEIKGLFSSLGQFSKGDGEGTEILLQLWDGGGNVVDRVSLDESYVGTRSRLSIAGGIQPAILSRVFDADDPQGMFARFLPVIPRKCPPALYKGELELNRELTALYHWIKESSWDDLILDQEAECGFEAIYMDFGMKESPTESVRAWTAKAAGQVGRVAIALHAIECYYSDRTTTRFVSFDTLCRAYSFVLGCFDDVHRVAGLLAESEQNASISGLLDKILSKAAQFPEGVLMPDLYRNINTIRTAAKKENIPIAEFTLSLCQELVDSRLGRLEPTDGGGWRFFALS